MAKKLYGVINPIAYPGGTEPEGRREMRFATNEVDFAGPAVAVRKDFGLVFRDGDDSQKTRSVFIGAARHT